MAIQEQKILIQKCSQYKKLQYIIAFKINLTQRKYFELIKNPLVKMTKFV